MSFHFIVDTKTSLPEIQIVVLRLSDRFRLKEVNAN